MENLEAVVGVVVNDEVSVVVADLEFPSNHFFSLFLAFSQSLAAVEFDGNFFHSQGEFDGVSLLDKEKESVFTVLFIPILLAAEN